MMMASVVDVVAETPEEATGKLKITLHAADIKRDGTQRDAGGGWEG
jgi:hypothetical protein